MWAFWHSYPPTENTEGHCETKCILPFCHFVCNQAGIRTSRIRGSLKGIERCMGIAQSATLFRKKKMQNWNWLNFGERNFSLSKGPICSLQTENDKFVIQGLFCFGLYCLVSAPLGSGLGPLSPGAELHFNGSQPTCEVTFSVFQNRFWGF